MKSCSPKSRKRNLFNSSPLSKLRTYSSFSSTNWSSTKSYTPSQTQIDLYERINEYLDEKRLYIIEPGYHMTRKMESCPTILEEQKGSSIISTMKKEIKSLDFTKSSLFQRRKTNEPSKSS